VYLLLLFVGHGDPNIHEISWIVFYCSLALWKKIEKRKLVQRLTSLTPYQSEKYRLRKYYIETFRILDYFSYTFSLMLYIFLLLLCPISQVLFLFTFFWYLLLHIYCQNTIRKYTFNIGYLGPSTSVVKPMLKAPMLNVLLLTSVFKNRC